MKAIEKWLLPPTCVVSKQSAEQFDLSDSVLQDLSSPFSVCPQCCELSLEGDLCGACLTKPPAFDRTQVGFYFEEPLSKLIYDLKYHQQVAYARLLSEMVIEQFDIAGVQALVPIPTHPLRRRERGYNQADLIAKALGKLLELPVISHAIKRIKHTESQTHLSAKQRHQNLTKAFQIETECFAKLTHIALVDDVITTGATMQKVAELIKKQTQVEHLQAWAIAKTK
ncbi:MAG: hypothetical protein ISEC1_P2057 [Thiomicrorhabdus sp.]|nr:MAG: hypothetical protein ISEC1_P2057 [Thiomicrorhabdus sp.]